MSDVVRQEKIAVTGGAGFLGSHVVAELKRQRFSDIFVVEKEKYDLVKQDHVRNLYRDINPDIVIHLAAQVGGIGANIKNPGSYFYDNVMMGTNLIEEARLHNIKKFVAIGTVCCYPEYTAVPFKEEDIWNGYPEPSNAPYGLAKKMMLVQGQAYRQQYDFASIFLIPTNLYGPGDNFNRETSHVIPALIKKCLKAIKGKKKYITVWGTGKATRDFFYVADGATAIVNATRVYNNPEPLNLGSGHEISIAQLASHVAELTGFTGEIRFDASKPDGQMRRRLDISRARKAIDFQPNTDFIDGLERTIAWYKERYLG